MTRLEREQLIERYLGGELSGAEEEAFFLEVAANRELRQELRAYRLVEQALAKESSGMHTTHSALRAHIQNLALIPGTEAMVGAQGAGSGSGTAGTAAGGTGAGGTGGLGTLFSSGLVSVKSILAVIIVGTIGTGSFFLISSSDGESSSPATPAEFSLPSTQQEHLPEVRSTLPEEEVLTTDPQKRTESETTFTPPALPLSQHKEGTATTKESAVIVQSSTPSSDSAKGLPEQPDYQQGRQDPSRFKVNIKELQRKE